MFEIGGAVACNRHKISAGSFELTSSQPMSQDRSASDTVLTSALAFSSPSEQSAGDALSRPPLDSALNPSGLSNEAKTATLLMPIVRQQWPSHPVSDRCVMMPSARFAVPVLVKGPPMLTLLRLKIQQFAKEFLYLLNLSAGDVERLVRFEVLGEAGGQAGIEGKKARKPAPQAA